MPGGKLSERTKKQIDKLPEHSQHIFKKARESALMQYKDPAKKRSKSDKPEEVAHKVAWSAVKKKYKKSGLAKRRKPTNPCARGWMLNKDQ